MSEDIQIQTKKTAQSSSTRKTLNFQSNTAKLFFTYYLNQAKKHNCLDFRRFMQLLLINQKFCNEYAKNGSYYLQIYTDFARLFISYNNYSVEAYKGVALDFPANFVCLCQPSSLGIYACSQHPERHMFKTYATFCRKIKDANTENIHLYIDTSRSKENRTLMDLLPDAITKLEGSPHSARWLWKRQKVLNLIKIKVEDQYNSVKNEFVSVFYRPMLESRVQHIKLKADPYARSFVYGLDGMSDYYPMKHNIYLESLKVFARMISTIYEVNDAREDYNNMKKDTVWLNGRFEKYNRAFKALKCLNSTFQIRIKDDQSYLLNLFTLDKLTEKLELYFKNTEMFCQAANDAQINLQDVKILLHICLPSQGYLSDKWRNACIERMEKFGFTIKKTPWNHYVTMEGKMQLNGIPINAQLFVMKGNMNEGADDPARGEWSTDEYKNSKIEITDDFYDNLDGGNFLLSNSDNEEIDQ